MNTFLAAVFLCCALLGSATGNPEWYVKSGFPLLMFLFPYGTSLPVPNVTHPWCPGENVALGGRATQSSILAGASIKWGYLGEAINAIDGNTNPDLMLGSCSITDWEANPWWRVDLLRPRKIYAISITNRIYKPERLNGAEILVGNSLANYGNNNERCGSITGLAAGATQTFQCNGMVGRYVNVVIRGRQEFLALCEVQVFAEPESQNHNK